MQHLAWGDVAIDCIENLQVLKVHLKKSKTYQLGKGVDMYFRKTRCSLCPVTASLHNTWPQEDKTRPVLLFQEWTTPHQVRVHLQYKTGSPSPMKTSPVIAFESEWQRQQPRLA